MSREDPQMKIRLPAELKARIEEASSANGRTMNAEIVKRLEESLDGKAVHLPDGVREVLLERSKQNGWSFENELVHTLVDVLSEPDEFQTQLPLESPKGQFPYVISALEKELANSAAETWLLRTRSHRLGHALQAVVHANEQGLELSPDTRQALVKMALEACDGLGPDEDLFDGLGRGLDEAEAKVNEFSRMLEEDLQRPRSKGAPAAKK